MSLEEEAEIADGSVDLGEDLLALPCEQIGEVLGIRVKTVETRLYRARRLLRRKLGEREP